MPSMIFNSCLDDASRGRIAFDSDIFKALLVTAGYSPNKNTHTRRSDVTNEVIGTGYAAGGLSPSVVVSTDADNDRIDIELGAIEWRDATITARGAVYYKSRGGNAAEDELVAYIDFGGDVRSTSGKFSLTASTLRIHN